MAKQTAQKIAALAVLALSLWVQVTSPLHLSTDYYRYLWQGRVSNNGQANYALRPWDYGVERANSGLFERMDWRDVSTVYPPVAEAYYRIPAAIFDSNLASSKSFDTRLSLSRAPNILLFLLCGVLILMITKSKKAAYVWLILPITGFEYVSSAHIDILSTTFVLIALYLLKIVATKYSLLSSAAVGVLIGLAAMTKITPIVLSLPIGLYLFRLDKRSLAAYIGGLCATLAVFAHTFTADNFAYTHRLLEWGSGKEFVLGNPLYTIFIYLFGPSGLIFPKTIAFILFIVVVLKTCKKMASLGIFSYSQMLHSCVTLSFVALLASPILLPWYLVLPGTIYLLYIWQDVGVLEAKHARCLLVLAMLYFAQYIDRAQILQQGTRQALMFIVSISVAIVIYKILKIKHQEADL